MLMAPTHVLLCSLCKNTSYVKPIEVSATQKHTTGHITSAKDNEMTFYDMCWLWTGILQ
jgi:hypothetical protein